MLRVLSLVLMIAVVTAASAFTADANDPSKFYGKFAGPAVTEFDSNPAAMGQKRSSEVEVKADTHKGFRLSWSTEISDQPDSEPRVRSTEMHFVPSQQTGVWHAINTGDPLRGQALIFAHIDESTLTVYIVGVEQNGRLMTAIYRRTVNGDDMALEFERSEDGKRERLVRGALKRSKS